MWKQEGVLCTGQCLRGDLQEELTTPKGETQSEARGLDPDHYCIGTCTRHLDWSDGQCSSGPPGRVHAAKHHPSIARRVCYVSRYHTRTHTARRVCHSVGGYSRLTGARKVLWGPAGMPSAPKDFGPNFDFPAHSLNSGPTDAPCDSNSVGYPSSG